MNLNNDINHKKILSYLLMKEYEQTLLYVVKKSSFI